MSRNARGTKRSSRNDRQNKRRGLTTRLLYLLRKFGIFLAICIFLTWISAWFFLSGAAEQSWAWTKKAVIHEAADQGFRVENILIEGRYHTDPALLQAILNTDQGASLLDFTPEDVRPLIEKISWVKSARILRRLPDTIHIVLEERVPFALWQTGKNIYVIDRDGVTLTDQITEEYQDLILITGDNAPQNAPELIDILHAEPVLLEQVESAPFVGKRRWDLILKNGITIRLPEMDMGLALRRLIQAEESDQILEKNINLIDLRDPDRMIIETNRSH